MSQLTLCAGSVIDSTPAPQIRSADREWRLSLMLMRAVGFMRPASPVRLDPRLMDDIGLSPADLEALHI